MAQSASAIRIVVATPGISGYPQGGGVWSWALQYVQGLRALGHRVLWLDRFRPSKRPLFDQRALAVSEGRVQALGLAGQWALLYGPAAHSPDDLDRCTVYALSKKALLAEVRNADLLWNLAAALEAPLLSHFRRSVLIDGDPGQLQVSALAWHLKLEHHDVLFTAGTKVNDADCNIPRLGLVWHSFLPPIYMPQWGPDTVASGTLPISSVTQWNWPHQFWLNDRVYSDSKRDAYLQYLRLPQLCKYPFTLAVNIRPDDRTGDRELLASTGWTLVHPHRVARTPALYATFIRHSLCEFGCAKPIYVDLKTGWFSERSASYLACGRPVLAENTGFSDHIEAGRGLLSFSTLEEAVSCVDTILTRYSYHQRVCRDIAHSYFSSDIVLPRMIDLSFSRQTAPKGS